MVAYGAAQLAWKLKVEHREPGRHSTLTGPGQALGTPGAGARAFTGPMAGPQGPAGVPTGGHRAFTAPEGGATGGHRVLTGPEGGGGGGQAASRGDGPTVRGIEKVMDGVLEARAEAGRVFVHQAFDSGHLLRRLEGIEGRHDREFGFGRLVEWAASGEGVAAVEQVGPAQVLVRALTPDLAVRATHPLRMWGDPTVIAHGRTAWVFFHSRQATAVDTSVGLPWGETGQLAVIEFDLAGGLALPPRELGPYAQWFLNEDNRCAPVTRPGGAQWHRAVLLGGRARLHRGARAVRPAPGLPAVAGTVPGRSRRRRASHGARAGAGLAAPGRPAPGAVVHLRFGGAGGRRRGRPDQDASCRAPGAARCAGFPRVARSTRSAPTR